MIFNENDGLINLNKILQNTRTFILYKKLIYKN